jgi:hypothetical protein
MTAAPMVAQDAFPALSDACSYGVQSKGRDAAGSPLVRVNAVSTTSLFYAEGALPPPCAVGPSASRRWLVIWRIDEAGQAIRWELENTRSR